MVVGVIAHGGRVSKGSALVEQQPCMLFWWRLSSPLHPHHASLTCGLVATALSQQGLIEAMVMHQQRTLPHIYHAVPITCLFVCQLLRE